MASSVGWFFLIEVKIDAEFVIFFFSVSVEAGIVSAHKRSDTVKFSSIARVNGVVTCATHGASKVFAYRFNFKGHFLFHFFFKIFTASGLGCAFFFLEIETFLLFSFFINNPDDNLGFIFFANVFKFLDYI